MIFSLLKLYENWRTRRELIRANQAQRSQQQDEPATATSNDPASYSEGDKISGNSDDSDHPPR